MAGHASNWFKVKTGIRKGTAFYVPRDEQRKDAAGKPSREITLAKLTSGNFSRTERPAGSAQLGLKAPSDIGAHVGPLRLASEYQAEADFIRAGMRYHPFTETNEKWFWSFEETAEERGYDSVAEMETRVVEQMKTLVANSAVSTRVPAEMLEKILDSGFKNQYSTKKSSPGGLYAPKIRKESEERMFGIAPGSKADKYPIYGYLEPTDTPVIGFSMYGDVRVRFKEAVKTRTTMTADDSLNSATIPSPLNNPSITALGRNAQSQIFPKKKNPTPHEFGRGGYEAQIHGKLTANDIADVTFRDAPSPAITARLDAMSIPWSVGGID